MYLERVALALCGVGMATVAGAFALGYVTIAPPRLAGDEGRPSLVHASTPEPEEESILVAAKASVLEQLSDPDSAKFKDLVAIGGEENVCGFVNAKNRFGGYVGYRPFHYRARSGRATIYDPPGRGDEALFNVSKMAFKYAGCEEALGGTLLELLISSAR